MRITFFPMVAMLIAMVLHICLCLIFVKYYKMDVTCLAIAHSIKDFVLLLLTYIYSHCSKKVNPVLVPIDRETFRGWGQYLKISLPTTAMICSEMWAFEVLLIFSGIIGVVKMASMTITLAFTTLAYKFTEAVQESTCTLIGNCIGANNVPLAKRFYSLINKFVICLILAECLIMFVAREQISAFFTDD